MKFALMVLVAIGLGGCSPTDQDRAHEDTEKVRVQSRELARQAEADAKKAGHEIDRGLDKTRDKIRKSIDDTEHR